MYLKNIAKQSWNDKHSISDLWICFKYNINREVGFTRYS